ncbi:MAG TPA: DUF1161 domain-containing protein [Nevskiaceae bacterium]|nr:DUF1161 domain-containing protein [Nevskiaceae bacterium]
MKRITMGLGLAILAATGICLAGTPCDQVKAKVEDKIKSHGVKAYTLDIVPAGENKDGKVVGTCEGGKKQLVYKRG